MAALINPSPDILDTELKLNRYWNFRGIIDSSSNSIVAEMLGKATSQITALGGPNPSRAIGNDIAQEIETKFHLEPGSLDATPDRRISNEDPKIAEVARMMSVAHELDKDLVLRLARQVMGHTIAVKSEINKQPGRTTIKGSEILAGAKPSRRKQG